MKAPARPDDLIGQKAEGSRGMNAEILDRATRLRKGEELDSERLSAFLAERFPAAHGALEVLQFPSGFSNLTYLLRWSGREWVLRRPPFGANIKTAHDMGREFRVLSHLARVYPRAPEPLVFCEDAGVLGAPFYIMARIQGVILRGKAPPGLALDAETMGNLSRSFVDCLVDLHALDIGGMGLEGLGRPEGYVARQVAGWAKRYANARTDELVEMEAAARWLMENQPGESGAALIHNDFKYDNLVLDPENLTHILGVLDWEMATLGDPLMDLGTSLAYWAEAGDPEALRMFGVTHLPGNLRRDQLLMRYQEKTGQRVAHPVFYYAFGLFKLGVIGQQIYARFKKGHTRDARFGALIHVVRACGVTAQHAIENNRISGLY